MKEKIYFNYAERWNLRFDIDHYHSRKRRKSVATVVIVGMAVSLLFVLPWFWQFKLDNDLIKTEESIVSYSEVAAVLQEFDKLKIDITIMESFLQTIDEQSKNPQIILEQFEKLLPEGTAIGSLSLQPDNSLQIGMTLLGPREVASLWINLRNSGMFEDFYIDYVSFEDQSQSINLTFKLSDKVII